MRHCNKWGQKFQNYGFRLPASREAIPGRSSITFGFGFTGQRRGFFGHGRGRGRGMGFQMRGRVPYIGRSYPIRGIAPKTIPYSY